MGTVALQRDLVITLKRETYLNVGILNEVQRLPPDLSKQLFKEGALEKPTQHFFNHLSHYLVGILDLQKEAGLPWPLYDTASERAYRNEFSKIINEYSSKNLLSPVMSSYLVNPGCYKVTLLMFQLSQLAVQQMLQSKLSKMERKELYNDMSEAYKSQNKENFTEKIEKETNYVLSKFSNYMQKRQTMEKIAELLREQITKMENKLTSLNAQMYINELVDNFIKQHSFEGEIVNEILKIKNIYKPSPIFDVWLSSVDENIDKLEAVWNDKISSFLHICKEAAENTKVLIERHTGEIDKNTYMVEFNPKTDVICTKELQNDCNSQQKYILRNIVKNDKLNFPNLIRGFVISICYILKNVEIGEEIYEFNDYLEVGQRNLNESVSALKSLNERIMNMDKRLETSTLPSIPSVFMKDVRMIPPLPNLTQLKAIRASNPQFDLFSPWSRSKHNFNLYKKNNVKLAKSQLKSLLNAQFYQPKESVMKNLKFSQFITSQNHNANSTHNMSIISHINRGNETIAECSSGFTKKQISRLLSSKKSSSCMKVRFKTHRPDNVKTGNLFNESVISNENSGLYRSYSSPNLSDNRDKKSVQKTRQRKLSVMHPTLLELSGISALESDSCRLSQDNMNLSSSKTLSDSVSMPVITIQEIENPINSTLNKVEVNLNLEIQSDNESRTSLQHNIEEVPDTRSDTPNNTRLIKKPSSIEKIISRFRKVRANASKHREEEFNSIQSLVEEKENSNSINMLTEKKVLLPDLLSPSYNISNGLANENIDNFVVDRNWKQDRKPRESLGTALGVDDTFLDQFDLID